ncbi:hypothetical protein J6590_069642 [Homalodisca vitripennis]|nr:hypothetical protein J6590_069642 [Homalodisca vitripennis]
MAREARRSPPVAARHNVKSQQRLENTSDETTSQGSPPVAARHNVKSQQRLESTSDVETTSVYLLAISLSHQLEYDVPMFQCDGDEREARKGVHQ